MSLARWLPPAWQQAECGAFDFRNQIDISEFPEWCVGCGVDPMDMFAALVKGRR